MRVHCAHFQYTGFDAHVSFFGELRGSYVCCITWYDIVFIWKSVPSQKGLRVIQPPSHERQVHSKHTHTSAYACPHARSVVVTDFLPVGIGFDGFVSHGDTDPTNKYTRKLI